MPDFAGLVATEPFTGDTIETIVVRCCDLCYRSFHDRVPPLEFFHAPDEGLSVCEECVDLYLSEKPREAP